MAKKEQKKEQKKEKSLAETKKVEPVSYQTKKTRKKGKKINKKKLILRILLVLFILALISIGVLAGVVIGILNKYTLTKADLMIAYENSIMLDSEGNVIAELNGDENRANVTYEQMSKYLPVAFVSIEDQRFEEHDGVDLKRTLAAALTYVFTGDSSFGGSTITQQLVKNITKDDDRDATRKIKEMARAYSVEKIMTKGDILEMYLNLVFLGETAHGVEIASKLYFNKHALDLTLAESAFLAGINHSPNAYKPFIDDADMKKKIADRTKLVVDKMKELGKITEEEYAVAIAEVDAGLVFTKGTIAETNFSYHTDAAYNAVVDAFMAKNNWIRSRAENYVKSAGLKIYTTQNTAIQKTMEEVYADAHTRKSTKTKVKDAEGNDTSEYVTSQSAMVLIDNETGYVIATVGGIGEKVAFGFNRGISARHSPGSSIKPIGVISPSLEKGLITAATVVDDVKTAFYGGAYTPHNDSNDYKGLMTVRRIIGVSENIPEVKMMQNLGPINSIEFLRSMGISTLITAAEAQEQNLTANDENL
ncbi:MAG: penicillin-binding protein, partial [Lachnospiraceae bacterium]|nr:penicillin-binding protein [Lachnospiraceae bacterium]